MLAKSNGGAEFYSESEEPRSVASEPPEPPVEVTERPRRPRREGIKRERILDDHGRPSMVTLTPAPGFVISKIVMLEFDYRTKKYKCAVEVAKSRGRPMKHQNGGDHAQ